FARLHGHFERKRESKASGRTYRIIDNPALLATCLAYFAMVPSIVVLSLLKIIAPEKHRLGGGLLFTIFWYIVRTALWLVAYYHQTAMLTAILKGLNAERAMVAHRVGNFSILAGSSILGLLP